MSPATGRYWCRTPHTSTPLKRRSPKIFGSSGGSLLPTALDPSTGGHPYSTATDAEPINTVLRVLSCGSEWGRGRIRAWNCPLNPCFFWLYSCVPSRRLWACARYWLVLGSTGPLRRYDVVVTGLLSGLRVQRKDRLFDFTCFDAANIEFGDTTQIDHVQLSSANIRGLCDRNEEPYGLDFRR